MQDMKDAVLAGLQVRPAVDTGPEHRLVVRKVTSTWADRNGLHHRVTLRYLRRQCQGDLGIEEDWDMDPADALARLPSLEGLPDGDYQVIPHYGRDRESGLIDGIDGYTLAPYTRPQKDTP